MLLQKLRIPFVDKFEDSSFKNVPRQLKRRKNNLERAINQLFEKNIYNLHTAKRYTQILSNGFVHIKDRLKYMTYEKKSKKKKTPKKKHREGNNSASLKDKKL